MTSPSLPHRHTRKTQLKETWSLTTSNDELRHVSIKQDKKGRYFVAGVSDASITGLKVGDIIYSLNGVKLPQGAGLQVPKDLRRWDRVSWWLHMLDKTTARDLVVLRRLVNSTRSAASSTARPATKRQQKDSTKHNVVSNNRQKVGVASKPGEPDGRRFVRLLDDSDDEDAKAFSHTVPSAELSTEKKHRCFKDFMANIGPNIKLLLEDERKFLIDAGRGTSDIEENIKKLQEERKILNHWDEIADSGSPEESEPIDLTSEETEPSPPIHPTGMGASDVQELQEEQKMLNLLDEIADSGSPEESEPPNVIDLASEETEPSRPIHPTACFNYMLGVVKVKMERTEKQAAEAKVAAEMRAAIAERDNAALEEEVARAKRNEAAAELRVAGAESAASAAEEDKSAAIAEAKNAKRRLEEAIDAKVVAEKRAKATKEEKEAAKADAVEAKQRESAAQEKVAAAERKLAAVEEEMSTVIMEATDAKRKLEAVSKSPRKKISRRPAANICALQILDKETECTLCYERFQAECHRSKVVCSACTFAMCRICVHERAIALEDPFVVDNETGDFVELDPTACPICKKTGAFREDELPSLPEEVKRTEEAKRRERREMSESAAIAAFERGNDEDDDEDYEPNI